MADDWESTLTQRHTHNRVGKGGRASKGGGHFDARQAFGSYKVDCPAYTKLGDKYRAEQPSLELYGLTPAGDGLHGQLHFPHLLTASVILAGSRTAMKTIIDSFEQSAIDEESSSEDDDGDDATEENAEDTAEDESDESTSDEEPEPRAPMFEKNSFRSPKFWLRWQGEVARSKESADAAPRLETNSGYIVFSPDVKRFSGTISCDLLDWKNKALKAWKAKAASERDVELHWKAAAAPT